MLVPIELSPFNVVCLRVPTLSVVCIHGREAGVESGDVSKYFATRNSTGSCLPVLVVPAVWGNSR